MVTTEERLKILKMIAEGKITAEEGAQLLETLDDSETKSGPSGETQQPSGGRPARWFRVRVTDTDSGKTRVNVRVPVSLVSAGIKMGAKFTPEIQGLDMEQLMQFINSGEIGQIVDVVDHKDGERVEVYIE